MYLEMYGDNISAEGVALALNSSSTDSSTSFSALKESIRIQRGLIHPIIVNHTTDNKYIVIEGNTRLQIYRDFANAEPSGPWNTIKSVVYENLSDEQIHSIRLQSHLVGPRDWDAFSKAKYLYYLCYEEHLPMATIVSFCGGKSSEISKMIASYETMLKSYVQKCSELGCSMDPQEFSKFAEYQNKSVKEAVILNKFTDDDFATWVINRNVDKAQNVRQLPQVLKNPEAKKEFLKTNLTNAIKKLNIEQHGVVDLSAIPYEELGSAFLTKIRNMPISEYKSLIKKESSEYEAKASLIMDILNELQSLSEDFNVE